MFRSLWHFIIKCDRFYYKMCDVFYYKIQQLLQNVTILLQNGMFITECVGTMLKGYNGCTFDKLQCLKGSTTLWIWLTFVVALKWIQYHRKQSFYFQKSFSFNPRRVLIYLGQRCGNLSQSRTFPKTKLGNWYLIRTLYLYYKQFKIKFFKILFL